MTAMILSISLRRPIAAAIAATLGLGIMPQIAASAPMHGIAIIGDPALPADFDHLPYANPDAPKGGKLTYGVVGTFDSLNPMIVQGGTTSARGLQDPVFGNLVFESLLSRSADEPYTLYGLIAEKVETPPDRSWVEFTINPKAKFSDGVPVTVDDVVFTMELLRDHGNPNFKARYSKIDSVDRVGQYGVRFNIAKAKDRELPLLLGLMPVLPKHAIDVDTFEKSTLTPIIGTGPYILSEVHPPEYTVYKRNLDYWAKDLPIKRGFDNYDEIRVDYYRDATTMFEGPLRHPAGRRPVAVEQRLRLPGGDRRQGGQGGVQDRDAEGHVGLRLQLAPAAFCRRSRAPGAPELLDFDWINKKSLPSARSCVLPVSTTTRTCPRSAARQATRRSAAGALPQRGRARRDGWHVPRYQRQRRGRRPRGAEEGRCGAGGRRLDA